MEKITSFTIDHNKLVPGIYVSRKDNAGDTVVTTFDIRITNPNEEPVMNTAEIHTIEGSVEIAPAVGMADGIFDIVSSGGTLISNGLVEVEKVLFSEAVLIASPGLDSDKRRETEQLTFRFNSILDSRGMKYVLMNLPKERLGDAIRILPGMRSPTVLPLAQEGWCSIHAVISQDQLWERIERLKEIGAEGILILALENMIR